MVDGEDRLLRIVLLCFVMFWWELRVFHHSSTFRAVMLFLMGTRFVSTFNEFWRTVSYWEQRSSKYPARGMHCLKDIRPKFGKDSAFRFEFPFQQNPLKLLNFRYWAEDNPINTIRYQLFSKYARAIKLPIAPVQTRFFLIFLSIRLS